MDKDELEKVRQGIIKDGIRYFPDGRLLSGKKHGIQWTEGLATAKSLGVPQGQFGSLSDIEFAVAKGAEIGLEKEGFFDLPVNNSSFVIMPDNSQLPAKRVYVKVYPSGRVHAYPLV